MILGSRFMEKLRLRSRILSRFLPNSRRNANQMQLSNLHDPMIRQYKPGIVEIEDIWTTKRQLKARPSLASNKSFLPVLSILTLGTIPPGMSLIYLCALKLRIFLDDFQVSVRSSSPLQQRELRLLELAASPNASPGWSKSCFQARIAFSTSMNESNESTELDDVVENYSEYHWEE